MARTKAGALRRLRARAANKMMPTVIPQNQSQTQHTQHSQHSQHSQQSPTLKKLKTK